MQDRWRNGDVRPRMLPTPEQATALYAELAGEALRGFPVFDRMEEVTQGRLVADTAYVIAVIVFNYGGHFRSTSPDVAWSGLSQAYSTRTAHGSASGRFRLALGKSAGTVYKTAFAMLEAGVRTKKDLARLGKAPPDELEGMGGGLMRVEEDVSAKTRGMGDIVFPLLDDLAEL